MLRKLDAFALFISAGSFGALRFNRLLPSWNRVGKFASRLGFATANVFTDGMNVVVKPFRVCGAVAMDFVNNRVLHNHTSYIPINSSGVQMTGSMYPCAA